MNKTFLDCNQATYFKRFIEKCNLAQLQQLARDLDLLPEELIISNEAILRQGLLRRTSDPVSWQDHYRVLGRKVI